LLCGSRRFGASTSKCSGLCGGIPSRQSLLALLRIAQRGRCNRLTICDTECVGHKVISSRSSSSVQRDILGLGYGSPQRLVLCQPIRVATLAIASFPQRRMRTACRAAVVVSAVRCVVVGRGRGDAARRLAMVTRRAGLRNGAAHRSSEAGANVSSSEPSKDGGPPQSVGRVLWEDDRRGGLRDRGT
jgi:hypothetical protein